MAEKTEIARDDARIDALVAKAVQGIASFDGDKWHDSIRAALLEYGNQRLEDAAREADAEASCEGIAQRIATRIRALKGE